MTRLEEYFRKLRFSEDHHLGLGDIRLTAAMQEEVIEIVKEEIYLAKMASELLPCGHHEKFVVGDGRVQWCLACEKDRE